MLRTVVVSEELAEKFRRHCDDSIYLTGPTKTAWIQKAATLLLMVDPNVAITNGEGILSRTYRELVQRISNLGDEKYLGPEDEKVRRAFNPTALNKIHSDCESPRLLLTTGA